jgi:class 3 adenylate cyclase
MACAVRLHRSHGRSAYVASVARDTTIPLEIQVRAGLHTGEREVVGEDIGGMAVNIGARIGALAKADEVLVSSTVTDLVVGSGITFVDRGVRELKGVPGRWRLFAVHKLETSAAERIVPDERARRLVDRAFLGAVRKAPAAVQRVVQPRASRR